MLDIFLLTYLYKVLDKLDHFHQNWLDFSNVVVVVYGVVERVTWCGNWGENWGGLLGPGGMV
jgi:hypothetical protein